MVYRINIHLFQNNKYYSRETLNTTEHLQNGDTLTIAIYHKRGNGVFSLRCSAWQQWKLHSNSINGRKTGETGMKEM